MQMRIIGLFVLLGRTEYRTGTHQSQNRSVNGITSRVRGAKVLIQKLFKTMILNTKTV